MRTLVLREVTLLAEHMSALGRGRLMDRLETLRLEGILTGEEELCAFEEHVRDEGIRLVVEGMRRL